MDATPSGSPRICCEARGTHEGVRVTSSSVTVVNQLGVHARAAAKFVHLATKFQSRIRVGRHGREMDGKSIMGLLLLAAARGCSITISASGADEDQALAALCALVARGFDEVTPCA